MTDTTYETPIGEIRLYVCPYCGHEWFELCDADEYPEHCPVCGTKMSHDPA